MSAAPSLACKILTSAEVTQLRKSGRFAGSSLDRADGFIHMSTTEQVAGTLERHFPGQSGLFLVKVDLGQLGDLIRWEPSRDGALFPHLYGDLPLSAVTGIEALPDER